MIFRQAETHEREQLFREGYKEWSKNRTYEKYCSDNGAEDAFGTRYVLEVGNEVVSSLILLDLAKIPENNSDLSASGTRMYGIGSVLTPKPHSGQGYATELLNRCTAQVETANTAIFLYSDINPGFYLKFGFRVLPQTLQKYEKSVCMVKCDDNIWNELLNGSAELIPSYF